MKYIFPILFCSLLLACSEELLDGEYGVLSISDGPTYDYGSVSTGSDSDKTFTVTNSGSKDATQMDGSGLDDPFSFLGGSYPGTGGTCALTLAPAATCTIVVRFSPTTTTASEDTLQLNYFNSSITTRATIDVSGDGGSGGGGSLIISDGPHYDFGSLSSGNTSNHTFTVTNIGAVTATSMSGTGLAAPFSFLGGAYPGTGGTCAVTLAAGASCAIVIQFAPISVSVFSDTINLNYTESGSPYTASRDVNGTGTI